MAYSSLLGRDVGSGATAMQRATDAAIKSGTLGSASKGGSSGSSSKGGSSGSSSSKPTLITNASGLSRDASGNVYDASGNKLSLSQFADKNGKPASSSSGPVVNLTTLPLKNSDTTVTKSSPGTIIPPATTPTATQPKLITNGVGLTRDSSGNVYDASGAKLSLYQFAGANGQAASASNPPVVNLTTLPLKGSPSQTAPIAPIPPPGVKEGDEIPGLGILQPDGTYLPPPTAPTIPIAPIVPKVPEVPVVAGIEDPQTGITGIFRDSQDNFYALKNGMQYHLDLDVPNELGVSFKSLGINADFVPRGQTVALSQAKTGQSPAGTPTPIDAFRQLESQYGLTPEPVSVNPMTSIDDLLTKVMSQLGLGEFKTRLEEQANEIEEITNEMNDAILDVNDNPWLTEGVRQGRIKSLETKYGNRIDSAVAKFQLLQGTYTQARQEAQFAASTAINMWQWQQNFDQNKLEFMIDTKEKQLAAAAKLASGSSSGSTGTTPTLRGEIAEIDRVQKLLDAAKGSFKTLFGDFSSGYVDPAKYAMIKAGSTISPAEFDKRFAYLLAPEVRPNASSASSSTLDYNNL